MKHVTSDYYGGLMVKTPRCNDGEFLYHPNNYELFKEETVPDRQSCIPLAKCWLSWTPCCLFSHDDCENDPKLHLGAAEEERQAQVSLFALV
jgi:hypothetical protein